MAEADDLPSEVGQSIDFTGFYMTEMPKLVAFTIRLGADLGEARDIAQQAFVNAYPRWITISHPRAYLRSSASREFIRRRCKTIRESPVAELPDAAAIPDLSIAKVEFHDQEIRVFQAINALPARQRQVITWTLDGFTPAEISRILQIPAGAVRGSLLKARRELKIRLNLAQGGSEDV